MLPSVIQERMALLLRILGIGVLYALLHKATATFLSDGNIVSVLWLPSGLALAAVILGGHRAAWGILIGSTIATASIPGTSVLMSAGMGISSALEALLASWLLRHGKNFDPNFTYLRDFLQLSLIAGFIGAVVGALCGTSGLLASGMINVSEYFDTFSRWWMGDALGIILMTPLILVWQRRPDDWLHPKRLLEALLVLGLAFIAGQIIFLGWFHDFLGGYAKGFFMFLFVALAAVRLGIHGTLVVLMMVAIQGMLGATQAVGYFAYDIAHTQLLNYWLYMVTLALVGITLATFITNEQRDKEAMREQEEFFRMITENIDDLIAVLDLQGKRLYNSPSYARLFGDPSHLVNTDSFAEIHPDEREHVKQVFQETVRTGIGQRIEFRFILPDGTTRDMESRGGIIRNKYGQPMHVVVVSHDITERKRIEEKIRNLAFYDTLTQLPNRRMLNDRLIQALAASKRTAQYGALLFLDLDNFKPLNDQYGHNIGDLLLIEVGRRMTSCVRQVDTVARFGGDEFVVMLSALDVDRDESIKQAHLVAEKIRAALAEPYFITFKIDTGESVSITHHCTTSIGVVMFLDHEENPEDLIKWADMAMYRAKDMGRNIVCFYS